MWVVAQRTTAKNIEAAEKARKALELRKAGLSYERIAQEVGWKSKSTAYHQIGKAIDAITAEPAKRLRRLELERLDAVHLALWQKAKRGDVLAIDRVIKIMERRAKLLGLDAPTQTQVEHSGGVSTTDMTPKQMAERARELLRAEFGTDAERATGGLPPPSGHLGDAEPADDAGPDPVGPAEGASNK